ncbi:MAG: hypothetical protein MZU97_05990 [Bacillus subtilis]|nr:hypothetical protein [Bacillus subtilis]
MFQFSLPGSPSIYYGGEIGLGGKKDPDNRRCVIWDEAKQDIELKSFLKRLISAYHQNDFFKSTNFHWIDTSEEYLIYQKDQALFLINKSDHVIERSFPSIHGSYVDLFDPNTILTPSHALTIQAKSFRVLIPNQ